MKTSIIKLTDAIIGRPLCLLLGQLDRLFGLTRKDSFIPPIKKVLVIRPGGLGDFIYLLPTLKALKERFLGIQLDVLAEKRNASAAALFNGIDNLLLYDSHPLSTLHDLINAKYDVVIDSEQFHNFSSILAYLSKAKTRIGFNTNPFRNHLYTDLIDYSLTRQEAEQFLRLLTPLGIVFKDVKAGFEAIKQSIPSSKYSNYFVLSAKTGDRYRSWDSSKYAEVIAHLLKDKDVQVILVGGKNEAKLFSRISGNPRVINLCAKTTLNQLCQLLLGCKLFIGCDSGVSVLANALGVKSVFIFGATDERKWTIKGPNSMVVREKLACAPCYVLGKHKPCKSIDCMEKISSNQVISAINLAAGQKE